MSPIKRVLAGRGRKGSTTSRSGWPTSFCYALIFRSCICYVEGTLTVRHRTCTPYPIKKSPSSFRNRAQNSTSLITRQLRNCAQPMHLSNVQFSSSDTYSRTNMHDYKAGNVLFHVYSIATTVYGCPSLLLSFLASGCEYRTYSCLTKRLLRPFVLAALFYSCHARSDRGETQRTYGQTEPSTWLAGFLLSGSVFHTSSPGAIKHYSRRPSVRPSDPGEEKKLLLRSSQRPDARFVGKNEKSVRPKGDRFVFASWIEIN